MGACGVIPKGANGGNGLVSGILGLWNHSASSWLRIFIHHSFISFATPFTAVIIWLDDYSSQHSFCFLNTATFQVIMIHWIYLIVVMTRKGAGNLRRPNENFGIIGGGPGQISESIQFSVFASTHPPYIQARIG